MAGSFTKHVSYTRKDYRIFCGHGLCTVREVEQKGRDISNATSHRFMPIT